MRAIATSTYSVEEWVEDFFELYARRAEHSIPHLQETYEEFYSIWLKSTTDFLIANRESWQLSDEDVEYIEDRLESMGFNFPTFEQVSEVARLFRLSYETLNHQFINTGVRSIW